MQRLLPLNSGQRIILTVASLVMGMVTMGGGPAFARGGPPPAQTPEQTEQAPKVDELPSADRVLVAGATGGTGREVVKYLLENGYRVRAFVRDIEKARASLGADIEYAVGDVRERSTIDGALDDVDALISAIGAGRGDPRNTPEFVDFGGVKNMAEAAAAAGLRQFVLVSSVGVTHEDHVLNKMFNNVLKWKFKGEEALRASGVPYTIIRPAGLINDPGGRKSVVFSQGDDASGAIPRADLARVCVADTLNKTFEITGGRSAPAENLAELFAILADD